MRDHARSGAKLRHPACRPSVSSRPPGRPRRRLSHDADKLIRQLSLVAYLMAEQRPVTARDAKKRSRGTRRWRTRHSPGATTRTGPSSSRSACRITSQRDEFTGEELYTLQRGRTTSCRRCTSRDAELAALQTCLYLLEGQFAYSEPLRLALQNLALGRPNPTGPPRRQRRHAEPRRRRLLARDRAAPREARDRHLEAADGRASATARCTGDDRRERHDQPVRPVRAERRLVRDRRRPARPRRSRGARRSASRGCAARSSSQPCASGTSGSRPTSTSPHIATASRGSWSASRAGVARAGGLGPDDTWLVENRLYGGHGDFRESTRMAAVTLTKLSKPTWRRCRRRCC